MEEIDTLILFRPVNDKELELIKDLNFKAFPKRLPEQPFFYPVLNEEYAIQITKEWNVPAYGVGYVTRFKVIKSYIERFEVKNVGGKIYNELWIPANELGKFNEHIIGNIEVIKEFKSKVTSSSSGYLTKAASNQQQK